jgi:hypothetical protein
VARLPFPILGAIRPRLSEAVGSHVDSFLGSER